MRKNSSNLLLISSIIIGVFYLTSLSLSAQITVGKGSYSTALPPGAEGPAVQPKISENFDQVIQTNDFWSSLIFPYRNNPHSNNIFAHPLNLKAGESGLTIGYTTDAEISGFAYDFPFSEHLLIGVNGLTASKTLTESYGDWTATALWENETASMKATFGHGLPFVFLEVTGGNALITSLGTTNIWHNQNEVLGITVAGKNYGIFAPNGSIWTGAGPFESTLNGNDFFSVAVLPDTTSQTLEFFRKHAYAFVTNSLVSWNFNEVTSTMETDFSYETVLKDSAEDNLDETVTALYRHQWLHTSDPLTSYTYESPRGIMKVFQGNSFSTEIEFNGILPSLPDLGDYNRIQLLNFVQQVASETIPSGNTYNNGKAMGRFSKLVHIADQIGAITERDHFLTELKLRLEEWLTAGGEQEYSYNSSWNVLTGYPSGFGADKEINDHHFHASYAISSAATIAQYDPEWAEQENWGGMINLLVRDANNWDREDSQFPFLRNFDSYAGHAWAAGHADFPFGNNQESSSESMNFASATFLWGTMTNQPEIRDLGIFLYTNESTAIDQYWFDVDDETFPEEFTKKAVGIVWGNRGFHGTWFGSAPEFIHGINFLPVHAGSFYLAKNPEYIIENYSAMVDELGRQPATWKDVFWTYLSLSDPDTALSYYNADPAYEPFDGNTRAHTLHWLYNMKKMGRFNTEVYADVPSFAVFVNESSDTTYIAYNAELSDQLITFSDGFSMNIDGRSLGYFNTAPLTDTIIPAPKPTDPAENVISVFSDDYSSIPGTIFNINQGQNTSTSIVVVQADNILKYENLDFQTTKFSTLQNIISRTSLHINYFTEDATELKLYLVDSNDNEEKYDFSVTLNSWQTVNIPLSVFEAVVDFSSISEIKIEGNGTVYVDNIFFTGNDPVPTGPRVSAPVPEYDQTEVISIFSDSYSNPEGINYNPDWGQSTSTSLITIDDNNTLKYENLDYQGTDFGTSIDLTEMEFLHIDYWTEDATSLQAFIISPGPLEKPFDISVNKNGWQSIDIPLSEYSDVVNLSDVFQIKIVGNGTVYFDNILFWTPPDLTAAPAPVHPPEDVVSLFSNSYDNVKVDTWSAFWDQTDLEDVVIEGNDAKFYSNLNFAGIEFIQEQIDGTNFTNFRFDMWTADPLDKDSYFSIKLVDFGAGGGFGGGDDVEHEFTFDSTSATTLVSKEWMSFDIPMSEMTNLVTRKNLAQFLIVAWTDIDEIYIDNVYFYTDPLAINNEENGSGIPGSLELSQNYPNPFNPSTNIEFSIPEAGEVSLKIYNTLGRLVATLIDSRMSPGFYKTSWNASNAPSGVYFYRLKTGSSVVTKQMLLIK